MTDTFEGAADTDTLRAVDGDQLGTLILRAFGPSASIEAIEVSAMIGVGSAMLDFAATALPDGIVIDGLRGNDVIVGSRGDKAILGGRSNDTLLGDGGIDFLTGGGGGDDFLYAGGLVTITDFDPRTRSESIVIDDDLGFDLAGFLTLGTNISANAVFSLDDDNVLTVASQTVAAITADLFAAEIDTLISVRSPSRRGATSRLPRPGHSGRARGRSSLGMRDMANGRHRQTGHGPLPPAFPPGSRAGRERHRRASVLPTRCVETFASRRLGSRHGRRRRPARGAVLSPTNASALDWDRNPQQQLAPDRAQAIHVMGKLRKPQ